MFSQLAYDPRVCSIYFVDGNPTAAKPNPTMPFVVHARPTSNQKESHRLHDPNKKLKVQPLISIPLTLWVVADVLQTIINPQIIVIHYSKTSCSSYLQLRLQQSTDLSTDHNYLNSLHEHDENSHLQEATLCSSFESNSESKIATQI